MDDVLKVCDWYLFDKLYSLPPFTSLTSFGLDFSDQNIAYRQLFSLWLIATVGGIIMYLFFASMSYFFIYDHSQKNHPRYLKNQVRREISLSMIQFPVGSILTVPWFFLEVRGYSKLYSSIDEWGWLYFGFSVIWFLVFTDMCIYGIHRWLHTPWAYKYIHKPHHLWKVPTPFASHAFHPLDGHLQSLPYHWFAFFFPCHKFLYLGLFVFVNFWTISIHDGLHVSNDSIINGAAHHTIHHLEFNYNYGQYFTFWDRVGGSHKQPTTTHQAKMLKLS